MELEVSSHVTAWTWHSSLAHVNQKSYQRHYFAVKTIRNISIDFHRH